MTLFTIARKNIRKNFTNYFLYFSSMIFSIVIYFTFVSLKYDQTIDAASETSTKISSAFNAASIVLIIFVAIFIWYSNSFFTRKRKKEVALYSLLGVRKKQIGRMLFYENFLMGIIALVIGILLGSVVSKLFVAILMKLMGYEVLVQFSISTDAIINTVIVFLLIIAVTSFHGYRLIYRFKLIELFQADQESEGEPKTSIITALLSVLLLGFGYWLALQDILYSKVWQMIGILVAPLLIIIAVILGTYLLFSTLTIFFLKRARKNKKRFWNGINIISISQLLYRMKGNAFTLTIIAVLSATTLTAVGTSYGFYYNNKINAELTNPNSMMFVDQDGELTSQVDSLIEQDPDHDVVYHESIPTIPARVDTTALNSRMGPVEAIYTVISNKTYNRLSELQGDTDTIALSDEQAVALDISYFEGLSPEYVGSTLDVNGNEISFTDMKESNVLNAGTSNITIVVSDEMFDKVAEDTDVVTMEAYEITGESKAKTLDESIRSSMPEEADFTSFYQVYTLGMESNGLLIFIGCFLGLVFLSATGSIIYFKQLTEATADRGRYTILQKMGVDKKDIKKSIRKQIFFIFALPLVAGVAHSVVALMAINNILQLNIWIPAFISMTIYILIYVIYYFMTVRNYYKIVTK
ncbi:FtsX-like permease family protein [Gracilibacillus sp. S3-1-1]|uniref:FtsX-like permease family protein n=1 Tax=Gracilibacillus pellucidus TaxID=3095368 RepID=A0ACC6M267_9BACI|nr:FtsX-like permease family protein [Gracilibacillus sp. S3-1-1]MDX8044978.1 FtsX-like permease family protein [Gracilibacillus sp. S3-1-1]